MRCRWGAFANYSVLNGTNRRHGDSKIFLVGIGQEPDVCQNVILHGERGGRDGSYLSVVDAARAGVADNAASRSNRDGEHMPAFLIPVIIGIAVIVGGGYLIVK